MLDAFQGLSQTKALDRSQGCVRKRVCDNGDGFLRLSKIKIPDASNARVNMSMSIRDCEGECRKNCSCTGYANGGRNGDGFGLISCLMWFGDLVDIREYMDGGQEFFLRVDAVELGYVQTKRHPKPLFNLPVSDTNEEASANFELPSLELDAVMVATENFSPANKLGTGGFGSVYKGRIAIFQGKLPDGREVAVKRLSKNSGQGMTEFKNEVTVIAKLQHRNLVQIVGCCVEKEEKILIYEYMPNKSLDFLLFDRTRSVSLDWGMRHYIILGIARGVLYLHQDSRLRIIHRDLKASNILLDAELNPKISDFGMAKIFGGNQTQANTTRVVGTYGYMPPEYALDGLFSIKSDVFSFGVLLLEIISGKKNSGYYREDPSMNLIKQAWELWREGRALELVDPSMGSSYPIKEVTKFIQVGILCVQENAKDRPTMSTVILMLDSEMTIPNPKQPAFVFISRTNSPRTSTTGTGSHSVSEMSTTIIEGR
ncbi:hypothetical protein Syun_027125 [Stephania yunnanensis]|uniref:non-specific serine/threonine protein kinase n=1 Tax=Stephania yunnanensis TaxID=152371 RepID=A0AAP0ENW5_9MAGN